jgi:uncharacterized protein YecA (UPF0149 family)
MHEFRPSLAEFAAAGDRAAVDGFVAVQGCVRNEPCPCGSGKKYEKCCLAEDADARRR